MNRFNIKINDFKNFLQIRLVEKNALDIKIKEQLKSLRYE